MTRRELDTNFSDSEIACKCGCGKLPADHAIISLQAFRGIRGITIIRSGARCAAHHREIHKKEIIAGEYYPKASRHVIEDPDAFDIETITSEDVGEVIATGIQTGFTFFLINFEKKFVHMDKRSGPVRIGGY